MKKKISKIIILLFLIVVTLSCKKDKDNNNAGALQPNPIQYNDYIDATNNTDQTFELKTLDTTQIDGYTLGTYELNGPSGVIDQIEIGKLILYKDNAQYKGGILLLITDIPSRKNGWKIFDGLSVGLNFLVRSGDFNFNGYPNRTKISSKNNPDTKLFPVSEPNNIILDQKDYELKSDNFTATKTPEEGAKIVINDIKLFDDNNGAKINLKDVSLTVNPTFDFQCTYSPMSLVETANLIKNWKDGNIVSNTFKLANLVTLGRAKKLSLITYTDVDLKWTSILEYKTKTDQSGAPIELFSSSKIFVIAKKVPVLIQTKGSLRYEYSAEGNLNDTVTNDVKLNIVAGGTYDFDSKQIKSIHSFSKEETTTTSTLVAVTAHGKLYYEQEVTIDLFGVVGPSIKASPYLGLEAYFKQINGQTDVSAGLYSSMNFDFSCDLSVFHFDKLTYKIPATISNFNESVFGRHYFYQLPKNIEIISGDGQNGTSLIPLAQPVKVKVTDNFGNAMPGIKVEFHPLNNGTVQDQYVTSDLNGYAETIWTPGQPDLNGKSNLKADIWYYPLGGAFPHQNYAVDFTANITGGSQNGTWTKVSPGNYHSLATKTDGSLWAWGYNNSGALGDGTNIPQSSPIRIGSENNWKDVEAGENHSLAIKIDGSLWAWGTNTDGQLGNGANSNINTPTRIGLANNWSKVKGGLEHTMAIKTDGSLWAWGANTYGQLGDGTNLSSNVPKQIGTSNNWKEIAVGENYSLAIKTDGSLWAWGRNIEGQLGDSSNINKNTPNQIGFANWNKVEAGSKHALAIKNDGSLWAWGYNDSGQLGDGSNLDRNTPVSIGTGNDFEKISAGYKHSLAIKTDGSLWTWGRNGWGQLGDGTTTYRNIPTRIGSGNNWDKGQAGAGHCLSIKTDGSMWVWGWNGNGQLGNGTNTNSNIPIQVN